MKIFSRIFLTTSILFTYIITINSEEPTLSDKDTTYRADKSASIFLGSMEQFFNDMSALQGKSDKEKINIIFARGSTAIWNKNLDKMKEVAVKDIIEFAKANAYAQIFKQKAAEYMSRGDLNSNTLDLIRKETAESQQKLEEKLGTMVKGLTITAGFLKTWYTSGSQEALEELKTTAGDELCEWMVPSWGMFRMAQGAVIALGNYITGYAFETALEGNIIKICPFNPKKDKEKFAEWLIGLNDIKGFVETEWNDYAGYGGFWGGGGWYLKFTKWDADKKEFEKKEGEEMKEALISALTKAQTDLRNKKKELERIEEEIRKEIDYKTTEAKAANYKVMQLYAKLESDSKTEIDKINDFKVEYTKLQIQDNNEIIKEKMQELTKDESDVARLPEAVKYKSIDRPKILASLRLALEEIKESGTDGYDIEKFNRLFSDYQQVRSEAIRVADSPFKGEQEKLLELEENGIILEAIERASRMQDYILTELEKLKESQQEAEKNFNEKRNEFESEKTAILNFPETWRSNYTYTFNIGDNVPHPYIIGDIIKERDSLEKTLEKVKSDEIKSKTLYEKEKKLYNEYFEKMEQIRKEYENVVPKALQDIRESAKDAWNENEWMLGVKAFNCPFGTLIKQVSYQENSEYLLSKMRVSGFLFGANVTNEEAIKILKRPPIDFTKQIAKISERISYLQDYCVAEEKMILLGKLLQDLHLPPSLVSTDILVNSIEKEKENAVKSFRKKGNVSSDICFPYDKSDGITLLNDMKITWDFYGENIKKIRKLADSIKIKIKYNYDYMAAYEETLKGWESLPEKIKIYESALAEAKSKYDTQIAYYRKMLSDYNSEFVAIEKQGVGYRDNYEILYNKVKNGMQFHNAWQKELLELDNNLSDLLAGYKELMSKIKDKEEELDRLSEEYDRKLKEKEEEEKRKKEEEDKIKIQNIKDFYAQFKQAYETKNDSLLMSFISDSWEAGDGTTPDDLQPNFARIFRIFNEISFDIKNLEVKKIDENKYIANYELTITGRIFSRNLRHEEKSSISEELSLQSGKPKIIKTLSGSFWKIE